MALGNEFVDVFIKDTKKELNELFDRVRAIETVQAVGAERDKTLLEKMEDLTEFFRQHDKAEMAKYTNIENEVHKLTKVLYIGSGVLSLIYFIGFDRLVGIIGG